MGDGGAPEEASRRMELLLKEYQEGARRLPQMGFNGDELDLEPPRVEEAEYLDGDEEKIEAIIKNKIISRAGGLCKIGVNVADCRVLLEAEKRMNAIEKATKKKKEQKKKDDAQSDESLAIYHYNKWVVEGKIYEEGKPKLMKEPSILIVKVLLPRYDPEKKLADFKSMKNCVKWLGDFEGGKAWEAKMDALNTDYGAAVTHSSDRLF